MNGTPRHKTLNRLSAGFRRFRRHWYCEEHNIYEDLLEGQSPHALVIACSDSPRRSGIDSRLPPRRSFCHPQCGKSGSSL